MNYPKYYGCLLALLTAAVIATYWPIFDNTLYLDQWKAMIASTRGGLFGTRVGMELINRAMIALFGGKALAYYVINTTLHIFNAILLFALVYKLTNDKEISVYCAIVAGLSYVGSEAVFWPLISYPLFSLVMAAGMLAALRAPIRPHWPWLAISFSAGLIATSLMEIGIFIPVTILCGLLLNRNEWKGPAAMAAAAALGSAVIILVRTVISPHPLPYSDQGFIHVGAFIKLASGWALIAITPVYQTLKLLDLGTVVAAAIALTIISASAIATIISMIHTKNTDGKNIAFISIFFLAAISIIMFPFASIREKTAIPVIGSRYLYITYFLFILYLGMVFQRLSCRRTARHALRAGLCLVTVMNVAAIRHEAQGWEARSASNKQIIVNVSAALSQGKQIDTVALFRDNTRGKERLLLPPVQSHPMVVPEFIQEMLVFETGDRFHGAVKLDTIELDSKKVQNIHLQY